MRLDEGMVTHGEECDSCGLKNVRNIFPDWGPKIIYANLMSSNVSAIVFTNSVGFGWCVSACCKL